MLNIKNISKSVAIFLVMAGFIAGPFIQIAQATSFLNADEDCCCCCSCCNSDQETNDLNFEDLSKGQCGCSISKSTPPVNIPFQARIEKKSIDNITINNNQAISLNSEIKPVSLHQCQIETIRNSGPPIFLSISSLLI